MMRAARRLAGALALAALCTTPARAAEALIAVATNFREVAGALVSGFEAAGSHRIRLIAGSTGKLYAQIRAGAPFDALLAADQVRPDALVAAGAAPAASQFTFAVGRLTLWSRQPELLAEPGPAVLRAARFRALAIANPELAPYGAAAREVLKNLELWEPLQGRLVMGQNVGQAHALVATGNAELGLVSLSYVLEDEAARRGARWDVPAALHSPIRQDAVLTRRGADNPAARAFLAYLRGPAARTLIARYGYALE